jgi:hypothetical protein
MVKKKRVEMFVKIGRPPIHDPVINSMLKGEYRSFPTENKAWSFYKAAKRLKRNPRTARTKTGEIRVILQK